MEGRLATVNTNRADRPSDTDRLPDANRETRKVRIGRSNTTAVVDGHRPAPRDRTCERNRSRPDGRNIDSGRCCDVDAPVSRVATDRGKRNNDDRALRQRKSVAGTDRRNHGDEHQERDHRTQHVPAPPPPCHSIASNASELGGRRTTLTDPRLPSLSRISTSPPLGEGERRGAAGSVIPPTEVCA